METWSPDFWVAVATVAPVIVLTQVVAVTRYSRWRAELNEGLDALRESERATADLLIARSTELRDLTGLAQEELNSPGAARSTREDLDYMQEFAEESAAWASSLRSQAETRLRAALSVLTGPRGTRTAATLAALCVLGAIFVLTIAVLSLAWSDDQCSRVAMAWVLLATTYSLVLQALLESGIRRTGKKAWPDAPIPGD